MQWRGGEMQLVNVLLKIDVISAMISLFFSVKGEMMLIQLLSIYLFAGVLLLAFMFVYAFLRGRSGYAKALGALCLSIQIYLLGYLLEINVSPMEDMIFWNQIQYFGIPFFPAWWLAVGILYTERGRLLKGWGGAAVFAVPVLTFILRLTNDSHHFYYSKIQMNQIGDYTFLLLSKGPFYYVQMLYAFIALFLCTYFYFQRYRKSVGSERIQFRLFLIASILPYLALILIMADLGGTGIDYTALILPPCILLILLALTRYNFLDIKALARERVFRDTDAGLLLLNRSYRVVDFNESSKRFFQWLGIQIREDNLEALLEAHPKLMDSIGNQKDQIVQLESPEGMRSVSIRSMPFRNQHETLGYQVIFEDVTEREALNRRLVEMANIDGLSSLNNRRRFRELGEEAYQRAVRYEEKLAVLMMDLDHFKKINDTYGHSAGDQVIKEFSAMMAQEFRGTDITGRMGGEEFAAVMLYTDGETAFQKAEGLRAEVEAYGFRHENHLMKLTVSIGIAELNADVLDFEMLISQADRALYQAKEQGRNRVVVFGRE